MHYTVYSTQLFPIWISYRKLLTEEDQEEKEEQLAKLNLCP